MKGQYDNSQYFLNRFNVTLPQLEGLTGTALSQGGDFADLYFEYTTYGELMLRDGKVTSGGFHDDYGVGIRVLSGEKTGYAYSESTEAADMVAAARAASFIACGSGIAAQIARGSGIGRRTQPAARQEKIASLSSLRPSSRGGSSAIGTATGEGKIYSVPGEAAMGRGGSSKYYQMVESWKQAEATRFIGVLSKLEQMVFAKEPHTIKAIAKLSWSESEILMYNSPGELTFDFRPLSSLVISAVFSKDGRVENKTSSKSFRMGAEMLTDSLLETMAEEVCHGVDDLFEAKRPKGGKMPVVMAAGASGILLHEAMGHSFEADFNRKGQSIFADMTGKKICGPDISIIDDGTIPNSRGSINYDDEGTPGQKTYMVRNGILESYLHDRVSARWYGLPSTGNGRRESFRFNPIPRMRTTYMESGNTAPGDIIASVKKGIFVDEFANGQVKIGEGDFTFYVKSGYMIENGKLTAPIKDINVIGNGPRALADIRAVGNDLVIDDGTWTCGKEQSVAVSCGIPTVLVDNLVVGGE